MQTLIDIELLFLIGGTVVILGAAHAIAKAFRTKLDPTGHGTFYQNLMARIYAWWAMVLVLAVAMLVGKIGTVVIFAAISFQALREFLTMTPTRGGDHRALCWSFFFILPAQYLCIALELEVMSWIFIPVYAFMFIPIRAALAEDTTDFLARTARTQWGLMICVYFVSQGPSLLLIDIPGYEGENMKLLFFMVLIVQLSDVLQYVWGKSIGKTPISEKLSPNKTVEGLLGGVLTTSAIGALLWWATPFSPLAAWFISLVLCIMGFLGGIVMSAIKRDRGIKDFGTMIPGHGGVMDRIDSLCLAAPVFYRIVIFYYGG
ncbi:phosphatidate cytidylyltransferase [Coraliomargarita sinensis]|uniref:Phosphatidate cytidylyltransferase n=1 Tax=Coraliomargarita sinensis TaxID=2174842 RepID=A0A317ZHF2_9BACT|nr:phosphatidate cytidylyltransferase [Coraliomargarita sinensis]PXA04976.1 phosphatidate cytidylyltransferase [Coraliomargarita sinensis]